MRIDILRSARRDVAAAARFYEHQQEGLGNELFSAITREIDALTATAGIHMKFSAFHRRLAQTFPYAIYYEVSGDVVKVLAVLDCDPRWIERQLRKRSGE